MNHNQILIHILWYYLVVWFLVGEAVITFCGMVPWKVEGLMCNSTITCLLETLHPIDRIFYFLPSGCVANNFEYATWNTLSSIICISLILVSRHFLTALFDTVVASGSVISLMNEYIIHEYFMCNDASMMLVVKI